MAVPVALVLCACSGGGGGGSGTAPPPAQPRDFLTADDVGENRDPELLFNAPRAETYRLVVSDLFRRGGGRQAYLLRATAPEPDFRLTVAEHAFQPAAGAPLEITVAVERRLEPARAQEHRQLLSELGIALEVVPELAQEHPDEGPEIPLPPRACLDVRGHKFGDVGMLEPEIA